MNRIDPIFFLVIWNVCIFVNEEYRREREFQNYGGYKKRYNDKVDIDRAFRR